MTIENPELATVLVLAMAVTVLLQSLFFAYSFFHLNRQVEEVQRNLIPATDKARKELRRAQGLLTRLSGFTRKLPEVKARTDDYSRQAADSVQKLDVAAARILVSLRERLEQTDRGVDQGLQRFQQESRRVQEAVVHPSFHASTILQRLLGRVARVFGKERNGHSPNRPQEEDIFL